MACHARLSLQNIDQTVDELHERIKDAEENRLKEFRAAIVIQAWFRASRVRSYISHLNVSATQIQRRWRGYLGRIRIRNILKEAVYTMRMRHYNSMAVLVQKAWRGYYSRKYIFDYYRRKSYLEAVIIKNASIREDLKEFEENQMHNRAKEAEKLIIESQTMWARKNHHLLSTTVQPGIYNSPFLPRPRLQEYLLKAAKPLSYPDSVQPGHLYDPAIEKYEREPTLLPPLQHKPQGPFKTPNEVQQQRYRDFNPSLRVMTDYYSLEKARDVLRGEEWVGRLHDEIFMPVHTQDKPYEKLLHSTSQFGHLPYGTKYFREEQGDKHVTADRFRTVVPPIHVFDKLNKEYVEGFAET